MKQIWLTIFIIMFGFSACSNKGSSNSSVLNIFSDDTEQVVELVKDANRDLDKVKILYVENRSRTEELKAALGSKDVEKVRKIADELFNKIKEGLAAGENAHSNIEKAERLNVNEDYKEYLRLKKESLRNLLDAFEYRQKAAQALRDGYGSKDPKEIERIFKEQEDKFQELKKEGIKMSQDANQLARDAAKRKK